MAGRGRGREKGIITFAHVPLFLSVFYRRSFALFLSLRAASEEEPAQPRRGRGGVAGRTKNEFKNLIPRARTSPAPAPASSFYF